MNEEPDNSIENMVEDIAEQIAKTVGDEEFVIFGHSMNGLIGWYTAWVFL